MNVAFIPVRGGSKSIPLKNIKEIAGKPLVYWVIKAAAKCEKIDTVYVATDSKEIEQIVNEFKVQDELSNVKVISRSAQTATDTASTESAMLEFAANYEFDNIILIQATSPLLKTEDLDKGLELFNIQDTDSVLSVVRQKRFQWKASAEGLASPINYDIYNRPRRQEYDGYLVENGAFYITSKDLLLKSKNRISGNIRVYEMDDATYYEIDEPVDWTIIEHLLLEREKTYDNIPQIKMFLSDCDGCLTDGGMYYSEKGDELKKFNTKDGMGFQLLKQKGIITGIITGENVDLNQRRAEKLGVDIYKAGVKEKLPVIKHLCELYGIKLENVAYVGDDINDLEVIKAVGFGCCVADAVEPVKDAAKYISSSKGGQGAIREIIDRMIGVQFSV